MSTIAQKNASRSHRERAKAKGLVRIEVVAPAADRDLVLTLVKSLREGGPKAETLRKVAGEQAKPFVSALEAFAMVPYVDCPEFDEILETVRDRAPPREIKF